jgi:hypothetical protein
MTPNRLPGVIHDRHLGGARKVMGAPVDASGQATLTTEGDLNSWIWVVKAVSDIDIIGGQMGQAFPPPRDTG